MDLPRQAIAALDDETMQDLERLSNHLGCSVEHLPTTALMRFVNEESRTFPSEFDHLPAYRRPEIDWESRRTGPFLTRRSCVRCGSAIRTGKRPNDDPVGGRRSPGPVRD